MMTHWLLAAAVLALLASLAGLIRLWQRLRHETGLRHEAETALAGSAGQLRALFADAAVGMALIDGRGRITQSNRALQELLGYDAPELNGLTFTTLLPLRDAAQEREWHAAVARGQRDQVQAEIQAQRQDGRALWCRLTLAARGPATADGARPVVLTLEDIGARRQVQSDLKATREAIHRLYEVVAAQHLDFDAKMHALLALGCRQFGLETGVLGRLQDNRFEVLQVISPGNLTQRGDVYDLPSNGSAEAADGAPDGGAARQWLTGDWRGHPFSSATQSESYLGAPVLADGQLYGTIHFSSPTPRPAPFSDADTELLKLMAQWLGSEIERGQARAALEAKQAEIEAKQAELIAANAQLEALATTDGLTGVKNRRAFNEHLTTEFQRARRYRTPLSLLLLDVDKFKQYNDTHGHPAGDEVLRQVARLLQEGVRNIDFVARYGGEEFVLLLPNTDRAGALVLAERLRAKIEAAPWPLRLVTASFGAATLTPEMADGTALTAAADGALYCSKEAGRNWVTHAADVAGVAAD